MAPTVVVQHLLIGRKDAGFVNQFFDSLVRDTFSLLMYRSFRVALITIIRVNEGEYWCYRLSQGLRFLARGPFRFSLFFLVIVARGRWVSSCQGR